MKKIFTVGALGKIQRAIVNTGALMFALLVSGCALPIQTAQGTRFALFVQRGVILQFTHGCTTRALVYQAGRGLIEEVVGARPVQIPLHSIGTVDDEIIVEVHSLDADGDVVFISTEEFDVDDEQTTAQTWTLLPRRGDCRGKTYGLGDLLIEMAGHLAP